MHGIAHLQVVSHMLRSAKIPMCAHSTRLSLSQQRPIFARFPTASIPRPAPLSTLKKIAQNDASSIMSHITVRITSAHRVGAHKTRISFTIPMSLKAAGNGAAF
jgi:hypothetical protein